jgi:hypothetical protein
MTRTLSAWASVDEHRGIGSRPCSIKLLWPSLIVHYIKLARLSLSVGYPYSSIGEQDTALIVQASIQVGSSLAW